MKQKQVKAANKSLKQTNDKKTKPIKKVVAGAEEESEPEAVEAKVVVAKKHLNKTPAKVAKKGKKEKTEDEDKVVVAKKPLKKVAAKVQKKIIEPSEDEEEDDEPMDEEDSDEEPVKEVAKKPAAKVQKKLEVMDAAEDDGEEDDEEEEEDDEEEEEDDEDEDEEESDEKEVAKKPSKKAAGKVQKKVDAAEEEAEDDDEDEEDQEGEDDNDEEDDDDDEQEEEETEDEESDETPVDEEPTIPSQVKSGTIPPTVPFNKIVHIVRLPKNCEQIDIVQEFAKYGAINHINILPGPKGTVADVAYKTEKAAAAALAAHNTVKIKNSLIRVYPKISKDERIKIEEDRMERTVYVKNLKLNTTKAEVMEHFAPCGEIEFCRIAPRGKTAYAFIQFTDKEAITAALNLHNSILNNSTLGVHIDKKANRLELVRDPKLTILLKNKQQLESLDGKTVEKIFEKCGVIDRLDVLCKKNVLALICFKNEEAVKKAYKLNGKTEHGIEIEIGEYTPRREKTNIYVSNLPAGCTAGDLSNLFSQSGEIVEISLKKGHAIIKFKDSDAFCKSFLLDESFIKNQRIFIEPFSIYKKRTTSNKFNNHAFKRPAPNGKMFMGSKPKKQKTE